MNRVCIILVNYKTWRDTAECIESLLRCNTANMQVVVVENDSPDDSWEQLQNWAQGKVSIELSPENTLHRLTNPPVAKPIRYAAVSEQEAANLTTNVPVVFIRTASNLGFAGGNNVGLRYMLNNDFQYAWLLNNDTVIEPNAVDALVTYLQQHSGGKIGITGSKLRLYHKPEVLQGLGAVFNKYSGTSKIIGAQQVDNGQFNQSISNITYAIGAAMFVSRAFLEDVGLMSEEYFLYNEENDWSARAHLKGWKVGVAVDSIVYHKQGASTGNSPKKSKLQVKALNYKYRGKILLYKKYYRAQIPFLYIHLIRRSVRYLLKGNMQEAGVIYKALLNTKLPD
jgi:GT2 family glycosyltransferase